MLYRRQPAGDTSGGNLRTDYDAVVVGAGLGGLSAAMSLAAGGAKVLLLEQHNLPGGFATSFVRGRFEFEPTLHEICNFGTADNKGMARELYEDVLGIEPEVVMASDAYRVILTQRGVDVRLGVGIDNYIDTIAREVPGSRASVTAFMAACREVSNALNFVVAGGGKIDPLVLIKKFAGFVRTAAYTAQQVADALKVPKAAQDLIFPYWCYLGTPTSRLSFTLWATMLDKYISLGAAVPRYRSHGLSLAMARRLEELGGRLEVNTRVEKIHVDGGKVVGIETSTGERIDTRRVVCNASPTLAYNQLVHPQDQVPDIARRCVNARRPGMAGFAAYLGLDHSPEELGLEDYNTLISPHMDTEVIYDSLGQLAPPQMQAAICLNAAVPDCSPPGTTILSLTTISEPSAWSSVKPEEYVGAKSRIADGMITQFEQAVGVRIREHIEEIEIATPQTFARYTGGYDGVIYGYQPEPWDALIARALREKKEVFIDGLYFCGGYATRGHGSSSSMLSGKAAAELALAGVGVTA